jgi:hypothetical protein
MGIASTPVMKNVAGIWCRSSIARIRGVPLGAEFGSGEVVGDVVPSRR